MLSRILGRREPIALGFEQRECVIVPQTATRVALHADVYFVAAAPDGAFIDDAFLVWEDHAGRGRGSAFRRSRWNRAVVEGRFRYPPQSLEIAVTPQGRSATLTFTDPLIPHDSDVQRESALVLEVHLRSRREPVRRRLWRVSMRSWAEPPDITWLGGV